MGGSTSTHTGYRILAVSPNSPISEVLIEPLLDYIVLPDGNDFLHIAANFAELLSRSVNHEFELSLYNIADQVRRKVKVVPRKWAGRGLLGADLLLEEYSESFSVALRVLNMYVNSPLDKAGLQPFTDFILGTKRQTFRSISDFEAYVKCCNQTPVSLIVYSSTTGTTREVVLVPNKDWGGAGYLGGDIAFGASHLIPIRAKKIPIEPVLPIPAAVAETGTTEDHSSCGNSPAEAKNNGAEGSKKMTPEKVTETAMI